MYHVIRGTAVGELFRRVYCVGLIAIDGKHLSNTDLSDFSIVGTCDIFVYQMRHKVM